MQQQADLSLHRVRQGFIVERTATLNRVRGLMAEFGFVLPNGAEQLRRQVPSLVEQLPTRVASRPAPTIVRRRGDYGTPHQLPRQIQRQK